MECPYHQKRPNLAWHGWCGCIEINCPTMIDGYWKTTNEWNQVVKEHISEVTK